MLAHAGIQGRLGDKGPLTLSLSKGVSEERTVWLRSHVCKTTGMEGLVTYEDEMLRHVAPVLALLVVLLLVVACESEPPSASVHRVPRRRDTTLHASGRLLR